MRLYTTPRPVAQLPIGAFAMTPLFALPLGAWLVETKTLELSECGFKKMADLPCISCGSTRATVNLLHGNFLEAIAFQPMTMLVYLFLIGWGCASLWALANRKALHLDLSKREDFALKATLVAMPIVNWGYLVAAGI